MKDTNPNTVKPSDLEWAREAVSNIKANCYLNIALTDMGACPKYFEEMDDDDHRHYFALIKNLPEVADEAFLFRLRQQFAKLRV